jgi:predicted membrane protein
MHAKFTTFVIYIVLLITFLGLINMIFNLHRFAFILEFLILFGLSFVALISAIGINNNFRWAWILLTLFFAFVFLDMVFIYVITTTKILYFMHLIVIAIAGFFISLFSIEKEEVEAVGEEKEETKAVEKSFKPGKFIASKTGAKYHAPKCDWAKRVKKKNAVWFDSKEEAKKAGYKKDDCVE